MHLLVHLVLLKLFEIPTTNPVLICHINMMLVNPLENTANLLKTLGDGCMLNTSSQRYAYQACAPSCSCSSPQCSEFHSQFCRPLHCRPERSQTLELWTHTLPMGEAGRSTEGKNRTKQGAQFSDGCKRNLYFFIIS